MLKNSKELGFIIIGGAEDAEVIYLNDFRWNSQIIQWHDLLLLLEGENVHLPAPKSHYAQDILLKNDTPIFYTSSSKITYIKNGVLNARETEMMWRVNLAVTLNQFGFVL